MPVSAVLVAYVRGVAYPWAEFLMSHQGSLAPGSHWPCQSRADPGISLAWRPSSCRSLMEPPRQFTGSDQATAATFSRLDLAAIHPGIDLAARDAQRYGRFGG